MRARIVVATVIGVLAAMPTAAAQAADVTVVPEGSAAGAVVIKVDGLERKSCVWNGVSLIYTSNGPGCFAPVPDGSQVLVELHADPAVAFAFLNCPTSPYGPRGNYCAFTGVTGDPAGGFEAKVPLTLTARFSAGATLTVTKSGGGQGTVQGAGDAIDCGQICTAPLPPGTTATLTATAAPGSIFTGWVGCTPSATNAAQCSVVVSGKTAVTATFVLARPLTVALAGDGSGSVMSNAGGLACPGVCTAAVATGTSVTLTAVPATGSVFSGWTGCPSPTNGTCEITLTQALTVTASFSLAPVNAEVLRWRTVRSGAQRTMRVAIGAREPVTVELRVLRGGKVVVKRTIGRFRPGTRDVTLPIPRRVAAGRATLDVVLTNDAGSTETKRVRIRLPRPSR